MVLQRLKQLWRNSITAKAATIGILVLVMLIPVSMIEGIVHDRSTNRAVAERDIMQAWGHAQTVAGPVLVLPYSTVRSLKYGMSSIWEGEAIILPESLNANASINPEIRYRGIHKVPVYNADVALDGSFRIEDLEDLEFDMQDIQWDQAYVALGIADPRAIQQTPSITINGKSIQFTPQQQAIDGMPQQIVAKLPSLHAGDSGAVEFDFSLRLDLNGSQQLKFLPYGDTTRVKLLSSWDAPKFFGSYLPVERTVDADGFSAEWRVSSIGRELPSRWVAGAVNPDKVAGSAFGVELYTTVSLYRLMLRAITYAVLFIALTFVAWFLFEILAKLRLHPLQYLMVGLANALFFLLLLSFAEHAGFGWAYLASAIASSGLITGYSQAVLGQGGRALVMFGVLAVLYGFLYMTLRAEDYAMLFGAIALWIALAAVMYLTRKIDWYGIGSVRDEDPGSTQARLL